MTMFCEAKTMNYRIFVGTRIVVSVLLPILVFEPCLHTLHGHIANRSFDSMVSS
jgi:hypothetical protein